LSVPVGMPPVGRAAGDSDRKQCQQRGDKVGAGVNRLGDEPEAPGREPSPELERNENAGSSNRNKSSAPLGSHPRKATRNLATGGRSKGRPLEPVLLVAESAEHFARVPGPWPGTSPSTSGRAESRRTGGRE